MTGKRLVQDKIFYLGRAGGGGRETKAMLVGVESAMSEQQLKRHCIRAMAQEQGSRGDFWEKQPSSSAIGRGDPLFVPNFSQEGRNNIFSEGL